MDAALTTEEWQIETIDNGPPPGNDNLGISEFRKFRKNLGNAFKLAVFCSVRADRIQVAWWQIAIFGLISLLIPLVHDLQSIGMNGEIAWDVLPAALVHLPIILFASIAVAYALGRGEETLLLLQTFLMISAVIDTALYVIYLTAYMPYIERLLKIVSYAGYLPPAVWLAIACAKATADLLLVSIPRRALSYGLCAVLIVVPFTHVRRDLSLWQQVTNDAQADSSDADLKLDEEIFYEQSKVLERELAARETWSSRGHRPLFHRYRWLRRSGCFYEGDQCRESPVSGALRHKR